MNVFDAVRKLTSTNAHAWFRSFRSSYISLNVFLFLKVEPNDRDSGVGDDGIRPIPRRGSVSSSVGKVNYGYEQDTQSQSDMNFESADAPVDPHEQKVGIPF